VIRILQGIDLVTVSKLKRIMLQNPGLADEIFTAREREYCQARRDPFIHFAGRFAAKEACLKALGAGLSGTGIDAALKDVEVVPDMAGRPQLSVGGWTAKIGRRKKVYQYTLSISHSGDSAVASVILAAGGAEEKMAEGGTG